MKANVAFYTEEREQQLPLAGLSSPATSLAAPRYRFLVNTAKEESTTRKQVACSINWEIGRGCVLSALESALKSTLKSAI